MDLGQKRDKEGLSSPAQVKSPEVSYPSFNLNDKVAEDFCKEHECKTGQELTATVKFKVTGTRQDEYGHSLTFSVISMDDVSGSSKGSDEKPKEDEKPDTADDSETEEKIFGFKRPANTKKKDSGREKVKASASFLDKE